MGKSKRIRQAPPVSKPSDFTGYPRRLRDPEGLSVRESQIKRGKIKGRGRGHSLVGP